MKTISSRSEIKPVINKALAAYEAFGIDEFIKTVHQEILKRKVKYLILEYVAAEFYSRIAEKNHMATADKIIMLDEKGSDVIAGKILQLRLAQHYDESMQKAIEYILRGSSWLACDTLGERVFGHALLTMPERTIPILKKLAKHESKWIVRSVGVAVHYAVKKGLMKIYVDEMFALLLSLTHTTDFHTKKGIGWAAKTTAKFHPDIVAKYHPEIDDDPQIKQWFKTKLKIGLGRAEKYAHRYTG